LKYPRQPGPEEKKPGTIKTDVLIHRNITAYRRMERERHGVVVMNDFETAARHNNTPTGSGRP
jgi:glutathione synthase/RimK-type ligase-like ATP-grasp enzyme